jgi:hypothetical protein
VSHNGQAVENDYLLFVDFVKWRAAAGRPRRKLSHTRANSQIPVAFFPYLWYSILVMETEEITKRIISTKYDDLYSILT